jgi:hypothetical protein
MDNTVPYDTTKQFGAMTAELITGVVNMRELANRIRAKADEMGAGADGTVLEGHPLFGVAGGRGSDFYVALGYVRDGLNSIAADNIADLDQGG